MFFTKAGVVIAWLACIGGGLRAVMGFAVAFWGNDAMAVEFFGSRTTGQVIDRGLYTMVFGICLGILTEISRSVAKASEE